MWAKNFLSFLRAPVLIVVIPIFTIFCSLFTVLILVPFAGRLTCDKFIRFWARTLCLWAGIRVTLRGLENINPGTPYIIVSNHLGLFDIPVLYSVIPLSFRMAAKVELFRIPIFGLALRMTGFFPVEREQTKGSKVALQKVVKRFERGESFWLAPEGTRFDGIGVGEFKLGAFFLAEKAGISILPICIYGTQYVLPKHSIVVNRGRVISEVIVEILKPVAPTINRHSLRDYVRSQVVETFFRVHHSSEARRLEKTE